MRLMTVASTERAKASERNGTIERSGATATDASERPTREPLTGCCVTCAPTPTGTERASLHSISAFSNVLAL